MAMGGRKKSNKLTIHDLARRAGVSIGTVSRALCNRNGVNAETRQRILTLATRMGFEHRTRTSRFNIALVLPEVITRSAYATAIFYALSKAVSRHNWSAQFFTLDNVGELADDRVDGVITTFDVPDVITASKRFRHIPIVTVNGPCSPHGVVVRSDHFQGGRLAAGHLLAAGHRYLGVMSWQPGGGLSDRVEGFRDALLKAGRSERCIRIFDVDPDDWENTLRKVVASRTTALFVPGEDATLRVQSLLNAMRVRLPEDLSLVGFHVPGISDLLSPAATGVEQPFDELADLAVTRLEELMSNPGIEVPLCTELPNSLWAGYTVAPPPGIRPAAKARANGSRS